jgi:hypothetical protein
LTVMPSPTLIIRAMLKLYCTRTPVRMSWFEYTTPVWYT